jgi:hypothetical protein
LQLEQYLAIADKVVQQVVAPAGKPRTAVEKRLLGAATKPSGDPRVAAREIARALARKAYRRPASEGELDVLVAAFDLGVKRKQAYPQALQMMLKAVLVSPQFLFITPVPKEMTSGGIIPLDDYQLASRLSYLLWATMPDEALLAVAERVRCMSRK